MKQIFSLLTLMIFATTSLVAQKKQLTLDDVVIGSQKSYDYKPDRMEKLQWLDNEHFSYIKEDSILISQSVNGKEREILTLETLQEIAFDYTGTRFPSHHWHDGQVLEFNLPKHHLLYNTVDQTTKHIYTPEDARHLDYSYTGNVIAYTIDNNLYIATESLKKDTVTDNQNKDIVCGQTVHRNEFGIHKGTYWSPDGKQLAFYRKDESMVKDYPLVNINTRQAELKNIKYPMAGMKSHQVTIGIYNTTNKKTTFLQTKGPDEHYLTNIAWSPDGNTIYVAEINRDQDTMHLNSYVSATGQFIKTLFTETDEQYIQPETPMVFLPKNPTQFVWQTRRDGYNHIYLYSTEGTLIRQLTQGPWEVTKMLGFDKKNEHLFISSTKVSYLERQTYKVAIANKKGEITRLTETKGTHYSQLSPKGKYLLDTWSDVEIPLVTDLINTTNQNMKNLFTASNPYVDFKLGKTNLFTIKSSDSTLDLSCRMILPPNFDKEKKHPVIVYVYGGPHSQMISQRWKGGVHMWQHYMAQKGYVMFTLDNRGTSYRGADFEQIIHRQLGKCEMEDQIQGFNYLASLPYVDKERIGVFGWSYGGFMTTSLMTHYPETFKVGVAGGPVIDWSNYEIMYGERYMDTPAQNPKGYKESNVTTNAKDLQGRLLMIHGSQDPVVVWQHSQKFVRQCVKDGVQLDYFVYPNHEHNVRGKDRIHLMAKITQYFDDFL